MQEVEAPDDVLTRLMWELDDLPEVLAEVPEEVWSWPDPLEVLQAELDGRLPRARTREDVAPHPWDALETREPVRWAVPGVWDAPVRSRPLVDPRIGQLQRLLVSLRQDPPVQPEARSALAQAEALLEVQRQVRVLLLDLVREVEQDRHALTGGYRTTRSWLAAVAPDADPADVTLAKRVAVLPELGQAIGDGSVSVAAGKRLAANLVKVRPFLDNPNGLIDGLDAEAVVTACVGNVVQLICQHHCGLDPDGSAEEAALLAELESSAARISASGGSQAQRIEAAWVLLAQHLPVAALKPALEELEAALLPSLLERKEKTAQDKRGLALSPNEDGTWHLEGTLTLECGERLATALAAEARRDPANPEDTKARQEQRAREAEAAGQDPADAEFLRPAQPWETRGAFDLPAQGLLPRSKTKRVHDALDRLLARYLSAGLGGRRSKVPVQLTVTAGEALVTGRPGALPAKTSHGRLAARSLLRRWWCDAHITTLILSRGWKPLGIAHGGRTITGHELKAAQVQFGNRCAGDGCCPGQPDPLIPLVPHHVIRHADSGRTSLTDTVLICQTFHDDLHVGKKTLRLRNGKHLNEAGYVTR